MIIGEFQGKYDFLSNFYLCDIYYDGMLFQSSEHFYQSRKSTTARDRHFVRTSGTPREARDRGRSLPCRDDWKDIKDDAMFHAILLKFTQSSDLLSKLIATGNWELQESNGWGDRYWGVDLKTGKGKNKLGKALMRVRAILG